MSKILIYGSTYLTEICCLALMEAGHELCGYVPNVADPVVPGEMPIEEIGARVFEAEMVVSIQYDRPILSRIPPAYNLHTGLLPEWGGADILYHTLRLGACEQGATFHVITPQFDYGPILSQITYPVFPSDTMVDLYERLTTFLPSFAISCVALANELGGQARLCRAEKPRLFRRGQVAKKDRAIYAETPALLRRKFKRDIACTPTS